MDLAAKVAELEKQLQKLEHHRTAIYTAITILVFLATVGFVKWGNMGDSVEAAKDAAKQAMDAAEKAGEVSSETNIASNAYCALTNQIPKILEEQQGYQILLPASRLWLNSGITVKKDDLIGIRISGGVNTAISGLVLHDIEQTAAPYPWKHLPDDNISVPEKEYRPTKDLIQPSAWYRDVLMFVAKDENEFEAIRRNPKAAPEDRIKNITPSGGTSWINCEPIPAPSSGLLCFIVNDEYPEDLDDYKYDDDKAKDYVKHFAEIDALLKGGPTSSIPSDVEAVDIARWALRYHFSAPSSISAFRDWEINTWGNIHSERRNRIFYDDNIGDYLLQVRVSRLE